MKRVLLLHQNFIQHYRVAVYNYLAQYFLSTGYRLTVVSTDVEKHCPHNVEFDFHAMPLSSKSLFRFLKDNKPDAVIFFVNPRNLYLFPSIIFCKLLNIRILYWGHGRNLSDLNSKHKNMLYWLEHTLSDSIILYAEHLKQYISLRNRKKVFIANNTLNLSNVVRPETPKEEVLARYGVSTKRNILFVGRLQKRKKLNDLLEAHTMINRDDVGLVIIGPVEDADVNVDGYENVYKLGPIYGESLFEIMGAVDIYCMPGWVGLSIVDAFFMGLPLITQEGAHPPEISYLKDGKNGYILPSGDIELMAKTLKKVLLDDELRQHLSEGALFEYNENASIEKMSEGFRNALDYVFPSHNSIA